jgi:pimeloyl-ACP methyl ester carboxylesterase
MYVLRRLKRGIAAKFTLLFPRVSILLPASAPLLTLARPGASGSRTLLIFLPGIDDLAEDFEHRGVIAEMRIQGIEADAIAVDAHYGYYAREKFFDRLTEDVVAAAHSAGYKDIWLVGISLGGFGAALYAAFHQPSISGLILLAPYLGKQALVREIKHAGGLRKWNPGTPGPKDFERNVWAWIKELSLSGFESVPIYLGYGAKDRFAASNALLAEALPANHVVSLPGGHNWPTWKRLWRLLLATWKAAPSAPA